MIQSKISSVQKEIDNFTKYLLDEIGTLVQGAAVANLSTPTLHRGGRWFPNYDTGNLSNSITYVVNPTDNTVSIGTPLEYGIYIEKGCKAHWTSVKNLMDWVQHKFAPADEKEQKSIAYAIQHRIASEDMPPMPFLEPAVWNNQEAIKRKAGNYSWKITTQWDTNENSK